MLQGILVSVVVALVGSAPAVTSVAASESAPTAERSEGAVVQSTCFMCDTFYRSDLAQYWHVDATLFNNDLSGIKHLSSTLGDCSNHTVYLAAGGAAKPPKR